MKEVPTRFDHTREAEIYDAWEKDDTFKPSGKGEPFSMVIPPPNVTGELHLGHALTYAVHDTLARNRRRQGFNVLLVPGADHAGIATQALVEKKIRAEKKISRQQLGREDFEKAAWDWTNYYLPKIKQSLRRFGLSCDWERFRFTLDEHSRHAVKTAFVRLYEKGLIYRGEYLVNWDPKLQTAIADDEVVYEERPGHLYWIKYGPITLATTRPETKLGDTAIAVHPEDKRYEQFVGRQVEFTNVFGKKQKLTVIADEAVDPEFGTGALKVTPAHDPFDWVLGQKHKLPAKQVIGSDGRMTQDCGEFAGLDRFEAREKIVAKLQQLGLIEKITDYTVRTPISERSRAVIEPLPSTQWFVKTTALKDQARQSVKSGTIKFLPKNLEKVYFHWLDNLHDWCISRQLWWGHQIPAWYCGGDDKGQCLPECREPIVGLEPPKHCPHCGSKVLHQDEDVLDTWFSSALWPFSALGWPNKEAPDLKAFFPTTLLETGADILFFWVSRMIMMSLALAGKVPFRQVYFHGLILDEQGQKMSKSKGNVLDPLRLIEQYGADALRMSLIGGNTAGQPQRYSEVKIIKYRNFVTKIWNASRFVAEATAGNPKSPTPNPKLDPTEKKFFERLEKLEKHHQKLLDQFKLGLALEGLYEFFWHEFADKFIEYEKNILRESKDEFRLNQSKAVLIEALQRQLSIVSDYAPFVCEEIKTQMLN